MKYILAESAVGSRGRTGAADAETFVKNNPKLIIAFNKLVKQMGGKAVAMSILKQTKLNYSGPIIGNNGVEK